MIVAGDIVTLKSGSPKFVVGRIERHGVFKKWDEAKLFYWKEEKSAYQPYGTESVKEYVSTYIDWDRVPVKALIKV